MAMNDLLTLEPRMPKPEAIDWQRVVFSYDRDSDTLMVHLFGRGRPAVTVAGAGPVDLRVDPVTQEIVGFQLEYFLSEAVFTDPKYLQLAELAGVDAEEISKARSRIAPEKWKQAGVETLGQVALAGA
jgi:hypothetical protein